jgi:TonB-dependent SusC/RagA subfamily outer membrane receptor
MKIQIFFYCCLLLFICLRPVDAQKGNSTISGTVMDSEGTPVENALIIIDDKETDILTDEDGNYKVILKPGAIKIAVVAFGTGVIEEDIADRTQIDFFFNAISPDQPEFEEEVPLDEGLVNTGYNKVRKEHIITSIHSLDLTKSTRKYSSLREILMQTPGLIFSNNQFKISGAGGGYPIWVVDGVPVTFLPDISPSQVASIEVLKGTAAAIYGTRGFGGAVLITTRIP